MELNIDFLLELKKACEKEEIINCILSTNLIRVNFGLKIVHSGKIYLVLNFATLLELENYLKKLESQSDNHTLYLPNQFGIPIIENDELVRKIVPSVFLIKEV